ncbi:glutamate ligase domain-containing protein, partial [Klebsiella quasipneumoniae]|uniref:glutamate ligase domain-containing protein n=1 Tax=Klebsiella quasipneumoniae TaxID=1463165 RepID=UPI003F50EB6B
PARVAERPCLAFHLIAPVDAAALEQGALLARHFSNGVRHIRLPYYRRVFGPRGLGGGQTGGVGGGGLRPPQGWLGGGQGGAGPPPRAGGPLRASELAVDDAILRAGIRDAMLPGRFQIISDAPRVILDVAHNPHAAAYLAGRLKTLAKTGRVLAVIGMLHDKDIAGTLANLAPEVDAWYCAPLEGPRGATAEQLVEHLRGGTVYSSVAQAWHAAMADAKVEDTVLVCGSFHTVAQVMEEIDAGRIGGE